MSAGLRTCRIASLASAAAVFLWAQPGLAQATNPASVRQIAITSSPQDVVGVSIGLGHAVPTPVASTQPTTGFRDFASVNARLQQLAVGLDPHHVVELLPPIGTTQWGKEIPLIRISDADTVRDDGSPEPRVLISAGVHGREWISPEVALRIAEHFALGYAPDHDDRLEYLINNLEIYILPVLNPDGLVYTQRNPAVCVDGLDAQGAIVENARDGRFHRKNLTDHSNQEFLPITDTATVDVPNLGSTLTFQGLLGVDLNRNHQVGYANGGGYPPNSADPRAEDFHGRANAGAGYQLNLSEPETRSFRLFVDSIVGRLRAHVDIHSYEQKIYMQETNVAARDDLVRSLADSLRAAITPLDPDQYLLVENAFQDESGTIDALISEGSTQPASYTLELPPRRHLVEKGDADLGNRGFALAENAIGSTTASVLPAMELLADFAGGPAHLQRVMIWQDRPEGGGNADGLIDPLEIVYEAQWDPDPADDTQRILGVRQARSLEPGPARVLLVFSEPMKRDDGNGNPLDADGGEATTLDDVGIQVPGSLTVLPVAEVSGTGWLGTKEEPDEDGLEPGYDRYKFDTWEGGFTWSAPATGVAGSPVLRVSAADLYGNALDGKPETVEAWNRGWVTYEDPAPNGIDGHGGVDQGQTLPLDIAAPSIGITVDRPPTDFPGGDD